MKKYFKNSVFYLIFKPAFLVFHYRRMEKTTRCSRCGIPEDYKCFSNFWHFLHLFMIKLAASLSCFVILEMIIMLSIWTWKGEDDVKICENDCSYRKSSLIEIQPSQTKLFFSFLWTNLSALAHPFTKKNEEKLLCLIKVI